MNSSKTGEILSIYIGTPSVNLAINNWELYCIEHGLKPDGSPQSITEDSFTKLKDPSSIFTQTKSGKNVPKALLIDLDPSYNTELKQGVYRNLFDSENIIYGKSQASIYSIAYDSGKAYIERIIDKIRKMADNCENLDGIMIYSSLYGGTGSGLSGLLLENLADTYERTDRIGVNFIPSNSMGKNSYYMDYNIGYSIMNVLPLLDVCITLDNEAIYRLCESNYPNMPIYYSSVNRVISQYISGLTASNRLDGALNIPVGDIRDYMIPNPQCKYLVPSMAPLTSAEKIYQKEHTIYEITNSLFSKGFSLMDCETYKSSIIAGNLYYRGDIQPNEVCKTLQEFEKTLRFTPGSTRNFNISLNYFPNVYVPGGDMGRYMRSCCGLINGLEIVKNLQRIRDSYQETIKTNSFGKWLKKYDENLEILAKGDINAPITEIDGTIRSYEQNETEIIEEI